MRARSSSSDHDVTRPRAAERPGGVERGVFGAAAEDCFEAEPWRSVPARVREAAFVSRDRFGAAFRALTALRGAAFRALPALRGAAFRALAALRAPPRFPAEERRLAAARLFARPRAPPRFLLPTADREVFREPPRPPFFAFFAT
ncbi:MAG: hypothetical protein DMF55_04745 [Acidobacteria bacterium]|nr:MAG: hypothetical protein DMF55_04745 [Acidobacteriota bacterium]